MNKFTAATRDATSHIYCSV